MKKIIAMLLVLSMVLAMAACGVKKDEATPDEATTAPTTAPTTAATEPTTEPAEDTPYVPPLGVEVYGKTSYTVTDQELLDNHDRVVATVGGRELTLGVLQIYYWMSVFGFLNEYGAYASYFGLDLTKPLDQQKHPDGDFTWQQYFLSYAVDTWHSYQCLAIQAEAEGSPLDEEMKTELENLATDLEKAAQEGKYESVEQMIQSEIAPGITYDDYYSYLSVYYSSISHYLYRIENMEITDEMIETYFNENEEALAEAEITKEAGKVVDVRHILLSPQGGTTDAYGTTTYTDDEWAAAEKKAQNVLNLWKNGDKDEDFFAELAGLHTEDPGSKETGGLYEDVKSGKMTKEFDAWCFDASRKYGDTGIVKTTYGYHVMFYSGEEALWKHECREAVREELISKFVNEAVDAYELEADFEGMMLGHVDLAG